MITRRGKRFAVLVLSFVCLAVILIFAGCSLSESLDEVINRLGVTAQVTYYSNGGTFENGKTKKDMYYKDNDIVMNIGDPSIVVVKGSTNVTRDGYTFAGWYYAKTDADGNIVYEDEEQGIVELGDPVDFSVPIKSEEVWVVCAAWTRNIFLEIRLSDDVVTSEGTEEKGSLIKEYSFGIDGNINKPSGAPKTYDDYTFVSYYSDAECTELAEWPVKQSDDREENIVYYAKYIEGIWTIVSTAREFTSMNIGVPDKRFYILNDIDCKGLSARSAYSNFLCEIAGNGHTISNLTITSTPINEGSVAVFGEVKSTAYMHDITFENLTVNYTVKPNFKINAYLFCTSVEDGARFENVNITAELNITLASGADVYNLPLVGGSYVDTNWLFGGFETDDAFKEKYSGVTIDASFNI